MSDVCLPSINDGLRHGTAGLLRAHARQLSDCNRSHGGNSTAIPTPPAASGDSRNRQAAWKAQWTISPSAGLIFCAAFSWSQLGCLVPVLRSLSCAASSFTSGLMVGFWMLTLPSRKAWRFMETGNLKTRGTVWIPAFAGMTNGKRGLCPGVYRFQ